jgi:hypothetical protein
VANISAINTETLSEDIEKITNGSFSLSDSGKVYLEAANMLSNITENIKIIIRVSVVYTPNNSIIPKKELVFTSNYSNKSYDEMDELYSNFEHLKWPVGWGIYKYIPSDKLGMVFLGSDEVDLSKIKYKLIGNSVSFSVSIKHNVPDIFNMLIDLITSVVGEYYFTKYIEGISLASNPDDEYKDCDTLRDDLITLIGTNDKTCSMCDISECNSHLYEVENKLYCGFCSGYMAQ